MGLHRRCIGAALTRRSEYRTSYIGLAFLLTVDTLKCMSVNVQKCKHNPDNNHFIASWQAKLVSLGVKLWVNTEWGHSKTKCAPGYCISFPQPGSRPPSWLPHWADNYYHAFVFVFVSVVVVRHRTNMKKAQKENLLQTTPLQSWMGWHNWSSLEKMMQNSSVK